jgi:anti-anti-sigma regulatory factor
MPSRPPAFIDFDNDDDAAGPLSSANLVEIPNSLASATSDETIGWARIESVAPSTKAGTANSRADLADVTPSVGPPPAKPASPLLDDSAAPTPRLAGIWTASRAAELLALAKRWTSKPQDLVVDCSDLERLDIATIQVLIALHKALASTGHVLMLSDLSSTVTKAIRLSGLDRELLS